MDKLEIFQINEEVKDDFVVELKNGIAEKYGDDDSKYFLSFPTVYIHECGNDGKYEVYIGESNNVIQRTANHYQMRKRSYGWQKEFLKDNRKLKMYVIAYKHFNKSLTLDIENRLIDYLISSENVDTVHNSRGNPQGSYYPEDELDGIFNKIWNKLRRYDKSLFLPESKIKNSAIFKASPLHKLFPEQIVVKNYILEAITNALDHNLDNQLIFVEGDSGTGKTVLTSSTVYEIFQNNELEGLNINCCLLVNHDEQISVYKEIAKKLNLKNSRGIDVVMKPTPFINAVNADSKMDVVFVDEGHLLLTQGKQAYQGKNQLEDIMNRSKITIVMFDRLQVLTADEYWEDNTLNRFIDLAKSQNNWFKLENQIRISASQDTINWIDNITKNRVINNLEKDSHGYEIKVFDSPFKLYDAIYEKSKHSESSLSRIVATYDWEYNIKEIPKGKKYWNVKIGNFDKPWNRELERHMSKKEKKLIKNMAWAEQPQTINEIGSTFTIQGFDLSYEGLIIGPSVKYIDGKIVFDPKNSFSKKAVINRTLSNGTKQKFGEELLQHELRVLMTRGVNGLYIYACDDALRQKLKEAIK